MIAPIELVDPRQRLGWRRLTVEFRVDIARQGLQQSARSIRAGISLSAGLGDLASFRHNLIARSRLDLDKIDDRQQVMMQGDHGCDLRRGIP